MRILAMTFEKPNYRYGGGLGIIQSLTSLTSFADVDYVGPEYNPSEFPNIKVKNYYFLNRSKNVFTCFIHLLRAVPTRFYTSWKKTVSKIDASKYDAVFLDFSNQDFVAKWAVKHNLKIITRVHNIEIDMTNSTKKAKQFDKYKFRAYLSSPMLKRRERNCMKISSKLLFLTSKDKARGIELYGKEIESKSMIVPVCIDRSGRKKYDNPLNYDKYILITGLLSYGANSEGIIWFLKNVWANLQKDNDFDKEYKLVVAGGNPNDEIISLCNNINNVELINTPDTMVPYFEHASLYVAPIFRGAGMKVKVAEAFSYGLNVIGTEHALIGYDESKKFSYEANDEESFKKYIKELIVKKTNKEECVEMFDNTYSIEKSAKLVKEAVEK